MNSILKNFVLAILAYQATKLATRKSVAVPASGVVLITGASSGIGRHAAVTLAERHATALTIVGTVRKEADKAALAAACPRCVPLLMDVADEASVERGVAELGRLLQERGTTLVGLVNNAGVSRRLPAELEPLRKVRALFEVNFFGMYDLTQRLLPLLRAGGGGSSGGGGGGGGGARIVNIGSVAGLVAAPLSATYSASKFALEAFSASLRREVGAFGMGVSVVNPAYVRTAIAGKQLGASSNVAGLSDAQRALYAHVLEGQDAKRARAEAKADPPHVTTDAIEHALRSPHPEARYVVANVNGVPAWVVGWALWAFPEDVVDWLLTAAATSSAQGAAGEL